MTNRDQYRLLAEAQRLARMSDSEFAQFNAERAQILNGIPPNGVVRMPLPYSGVGGDIPGNG